MKQLFIILFLGSSLAHANQDSLVSKRDSIVNYAQTFLKTPYVWGGTSPEGFDCTGYLYYVYKHFGIKVSRASSGYEGVGSKIDLKTVAPADILLFTGTDATKRKVGHVGMVLSNKNGLVRFIHSSSSKRHFGVTITEYNTSGYVKRFLRAITIF
jgi:cell wall-associated NlpC family hydrolase